jgi:hypothetical protein
LTLARLTNFMTRAELGRKTLERDGFRLNRLDALFLVEHDLFGKPASTFPDHALGVKHDLFGKSVSTFPDHALRVKHDLFGKPASTFSDRALVPDSHTRHDATFTSKRVHSQETPSLSVAISQRRHL